MASLSKVVPLMVFPWKGDWKYRSTAFLSKGVWTVCLWMVCLSTDMILAATPLSRDLAAWYGLPTILCVVLLTAVTVFGLYAATAGERPAALSSSSG